MSRATDLAQRKAMRRKVPQPSRVWGYRMPVEPSRNPFKGVKRKHRLRKVREIRAATAEAEKLEVILLDRQKRQKSDEVKTGPSTSAELVETDK